MESERAEADARVAEVTPMESEPAEAQAEDGVKAADVRPAESEPAEAQAGTKVAEATPMESEAHSTPVSGDRVAPGEPTAVKRPVTPLFQYISEHRTRVIEEYGLRQAPAVSKKCKELFDALTAEERQVYQDRFAAQREAWAAFKETPGFKDRVVPPRRAGKKARAAGKAGKAEKAPKAATVKLSVKRPAQPHMQYLTENRSSIMVQYGVWEMPELLKQAKEIFSALPAEKQRFYEERYEQQKKTYQEVVERAGKMSSAARRSAGLAPKSKRAKKRTRTMPLRTVRPPPALVKLYEAANREKIMREHQLKAADVSKKAKEMFEALSDSQRKVYEDNWLEQKKAFDLFKKSGQTAMQLYKKSVRASEKAVKVKTEKTAATPQKRARKSGGSTSTPKKLRKGNDEPQLSPVAQKKAEQLGVAENGVAFDALLRKLVATPGFGKVDEEAALGMLQKNGGNVNVTRNQLREEAAK